MRKATGELVAFKSGACSQTFSHLSSGAIQLQYEPRLKAISFSTSCGTVGIDLERMFNGMIGVAPQSLNNDIAYSETSPDTIMEGQHSIM